MFCCTNIEVNLINEKLLQSVLITTVLLLQYIQLSHSSYACRAVLLQGELRDAAVNFDTYQIL